MGDPARPNLFEPLVNDPADIADAAAEVVGETQIYRNRSLITAAEDFAYILEARPGAFINIGKRDCVGSCPFRNPHYEFSDAVSSFSSAARAPNIKHSTTITWGRLSEVADGTPRRTRPRYRPYSLRVHREIALGLIGYDHASLQWWRRPDYHQ
jgi:hypothetical protein